MKIKHKKFGEFEFIDPLLQKHLEAYFREMREEGVDIMNVSVPEYSGGCVRAAIKLKYITPVFDVDESPPNKVQWINRQWQEYLAESLNTDDPN